MERLAGLVDGGRDALAEGFVRSDVVVVVAERVEGHVTSPHDAAVEPLLAQDDGEHLRQ